MMPVPPDRQSRGRGAAGRRVRAAAPVIGLAVGLGVILAGCAPAAATVEGDGVKRLYDLFLVIGALIFLLVAGLIGWSIVRYRVPQDAGRQPGESELPPQTHANVRLELIWWALPTILVIVLFFLTAGVLNRVDARANPGESLVVRVTGFQWQWRFAYEEAGVTITGTPEEPPLIVLPVDRTITFLLDSPDVVHAFYVPQFLFKRDVIPGIENRVDLMIQEPAIYAGQCAEFCGLLHDQMVFSIRAVSGEEFDAWLANQPADEANAETAANHANAENAETAETAKNEEASE